MLAIAVDLKGNFCYVASLGPIHGHFLPNYYIDVFAGGFEIEGICGKAKSVCDLFSQSVLD